MDFTAWIPAITVPALLTIVGWFARNLIITRLTKTVQHEFDVKLESVKADLRKAEEKFKAELKEAEKDIDAVRSSALQGIAAQRVALDKRKLEAADQLWTAVEAHRPCRHIVSVMARFKYKELAEAAAASSERYQQFFKDAAPNFDIQALDFSAASKARPFLTSSAWAAYSAYDAVCMHSMVRWDVLRRGLAGHADLINDDAVAALIKVAMPELGDYLTSAGPDSYGVFVDNLEALVLAELQQMIAGREDDKESLQRSAAIVKLAATLTQKPATEFPGANAPEVGPKRAGKG